MDANLIGIFTGIIAIIGGIISRNSYKRLAHNYRYVNVTLEGLIAYTNALGNIYLIMGVFFILPNFLTMFSHIPSDVELVIWVIGVIVMIVMVVRLVKTAKKFNIPLF
jgi:hypothetical protein